MRFVELTRVVGPDGFQTRTPITINLARVEFITPHPREGTNFWMPGGPESIVRVDEDYPTIVDLLRTLVGVAQP